MDRTFTLSDGTEVVIRPIRPQDKQLLADGLLQLSPESARARFLAPKTHFTQRELRYLTEVDGRSHVAFVVLAIDDPRRIIAVARYVMLPEDPETAEMAITVSDDSQGLGLGRELGRLLTDHARANGFKRFVGLVLSDNVPAQRLYASMTQRFSSTHQYAGVDEIELDLVA